MLGAFWEYFGTWAGWQKTYKNLRKTLVFRYFGELEEVAEALFWRCWLQDVIFGHLESTCGTCWRQDGQQDGQDGQHEGQDGVKNRNEALSHVFLTL